MKKLTVSIGIPAYNEEANIKNLLLSLIHQRGYNFILKEIIIVSDCSTDRTVEEVKRVRSKKIILLVNRIRSGQARGQNKIIKRFKGDVLILLNADVLPANNTFISELIKPFHSKANIGLTGPKTVPLKSQTFFENIINYSIAFKDSIFEQWRGGNNLYLCSGRARALKKEFAKRLCWKESLSEDAYSYLLCVKKGFKFKYNPNAKVYFKSPDNFSDHVKQSARFCDGPNIMSKYFDKKLVGSEYSIPKKIAFITAVKYLIKNPLLFLSYIFTLFIVRINPNKTIFSQSTWKISSSSKILKNI